jgi:hypothetical protein
MGFKINVVAEFIFIPVGFGVNKNNKIALFFSIFE